MKKIKSSETWDSFSMQIGKQAISDAASLPPQLILNCQDVSMATRLAENYPEISNPLVSNTPEVVEFTDGQAAVIFYLNGGEDILKFISLLGQGNYGTERLVIKNGIATPLPVPDRQLFRQAIGLDQIFALGLSSQVGEETYIWW